MALVSHAHQANHPLLSHSRELANPYAQTANSSLMSQGPLPISLVSLKTKDTFQRGFRISLTSPAKYLASVIACPIRQKTEGYLIDVLVYDLIRPQLLDCLSQRPIASHYGHVDLVTA